MFIYRRLHRTRDVLEISRICSFAFCWERDYFLLATFTQNNLDVSFPLSLRLVFWGSQDFFPPVPHRGSFYLGYRFCLGELSAPLAACERAVAFRLLSFGVSS